MKTGISKKTPVGALSRILPLGSDGNLKGVPLMQVFLVNLGIIDPQILSFVKRKRVNGIVTKCPGIGNTEE